MKVLSASLANDNPIVRLQFSSHAHIIDNLLVRVCEMFPLFPVPQDLERGLEASGKTHAQEIKGLRARNRALASEAASLRDNLEKLTSLLKVRLILYVLEMKDNEILAKFRGSILAPN